MNKDIKIFNLLMIIAVVILFIIFYNINFSLTQYQVLILIVFFLTGIIALKKNYTIAILFLISLFIFVYGRIILLPLLDRINIGITWFKNYSFSDDTILFIYKILLCNIFGILLSILCFKKKEKLYQFSVPTLIKQILFTGLIVTGIFFCINNYFYIKNLYTYGGYLDIYLGRNFYSTNIVFILIGFMFYPILIVMLSLYSENKRYNKRLFFLYIIANFIFSLRGPRTSLIASIFVVIYFVIKKIRIKTLIQLGGIFFLLIFFSQIMLGVRGKYENNIKLDKIIKEFIYQQGITGTYIGLLKDHEELFERKVPYLFSSFLGKEPSSQIDEKVDVLSPGNVSLKIQLSARSNYEMYRLGMGMGGNYIIEMYDFGGKIAVFVLSFLHMYLGLYIFTNFYRFKPFVRAVFILVLERYFLLVRTSFFPEIPLFIFLGICLIYILIYTITNIKKGTEK